MRGGSSSVGRVVALEPEGHRFDSRLLQANVEVSLSKTLNPKLLLISRQVPCVVSSAMCVWMGKREVHCKALWVVFSDRKSAIENVVRLPFTMNWPNRLNIWTTHYSVHTINTWAKHKNWSVVYLSSVVPGLQACSSLSTHLWWTGCKVQSCTYTQFHQHTHIHEV